MGPIYKSASPLKVAQDIDVGGWGWRIGANGQWLSNVVNFTQSSERNICNTSNLTYEPISILPGSCLAHRQTIKEPVIFHMLKSEAGIFARGACLPDRGQECLTKQVTSVLWNSDLPPQPFFSGFARNLHICQFPKVRRQTIMAADSHSLTSLDVIIRYDPSIPESQNCRSHV